MTMEVTYPHVAASKEPTRMTAHQIWSVADQVRRQLTPRLGVTPEVVAVEVDGGRLRTRATDEGPGVHKAANKEEKIACLVTLTDTEDAEDPQPEPPPSFVQPRRIVRLVQQMAGQASDPLAGAEVTPAEPDAAESAATSAAF